MLEHFPFSYAGSAAICNTSYDKKSRGLKPAAQNTEAENALTVWHRRHARRCTLPQLTDEVAYAAHAALGQVVC